MSNPFGPQDDSNSYINLRKKLLQRIQSAKLEEQIMGMIKKSFEAEHVVLSQPERKRLFSDTVNTTMENLVSKIEDGSISV